MNGKAPTIAMLRKEFARLEELLAGLNQTQITTPITPSKWSIKDVVAHLRAWQQVSIARLEAAQLNKDPVSIARLEAARLNKEPVLPDWLAGLDPESEKDLEQFNATIYETWREQPWSRIHQSWRDGFLWLLELGEGLPENALLDTEKYPWLKGYALLDVLQGSCEHHREHLDSLIARLGQL
jgi:hypothetical protein